MRSPKWTAATGESDRLVVFGRVAEGRSLADARAELDVTGERMARAFPESHADVRPHALRYTQSFPGSTAVIVDKAFADALAPGGASVVGRRIRYVNRGPDDGLEFGNWLEIVGVVPAFATEFTVPPPFATPPTRFYHAAAPDQNDLAGIVVRVRGDAGRSAFVPRSAPTPAACSRASSAARSRSWPRSVPPGGVSPCSRRKRCERTDAYVAIGRV